MDLLKTTALVSGVNRRLGKHLADQLISRGTGVYGGPASPEPLTPAPASSPCSRTSPILPP
jgi:nucleoside-diphosphate-sugar epimerase